MDQQPDLHEALMVVVRKLCDQHDNATGATLLSIDKPHEGRALYVYLVFDSDELSEKDKSLISLVKAVVENTTDNHTIIVAYSNPQYFEDKPS